MTLNEYQSKAMTTCMDSCHNPTYMLLNLIGEVGEFSSKIAKHIRKRECSLVSNQLLWLTKHELTDEQNDAIEQRNLELLMSEAGDCLWQLSGLCKVMGWSLEDVAQQNLDKLASRKERGVISGEGDER